MIVTSDGGSVSCRYLQLSSCVQGYSELPADQSLPGKHPVLFVEGLFAFSRNALQETLTILLVVKLNKYKKNKGNI